MRNKLLVALPVALFTGLLAASAPASAASLTSVPSGWQVGTEPTWTSMYWYVPDGLPAGAGEDQVERLQGRVEAGDPVIAADDLLQGPPRGGGHRESSL